MTSQEQWGNRISQIFPQKDNIIQLRKACLGAQLHSGELHGSVTHSLLLTCVYITAKDRGELSDKT